MRMSMLSRLAISVLYGYKQTHFCARVEHYEIRTEICYETHEHSNRLRANNLFIPKFYFTQSLFLILYARPFQMNSDKPWRQRKHIHTECQSLKSARYCIQACCTLGLYNRNIAKRNKKCAMTDTHFNIWSVLVYDFFHSQQHIYEHRLNVNAPLTLTPMWCKLTINRNIIIVPACSARLKCLCVLTLCSSLTCRLVFKIYLL